MTERVLLIIPAYNAERHVGPVVRDTLQHGLPLVVVDDGSIDRTGEVAREAGAIVLVHEKNRGKGAALKTAFAYAVENGFDGVITLDADGQHLPREIPKFLAARAETQADLIIGGRSHHFEGMLVRRRMANRFSAWIIAKFARARITDSQSGYRYYSPHFLRTIHPRTNGFDMESEAIVRAGLKRLKICTIPIDLGFVDGVSTSHYKPVKDTLRIAWAVFRAKFLD